jgi:hypothetical protein
MYIDNSNSPELNIKFLGTVSEDFVLVADAVKEASYAMRQRGITNHPIFPICKTDQPVGALFIHYQEQREDLDPKPRQWSYYVSFLDEFVQRGLVPEDGIEAFKEAYRDPDEYCCLFVIDPELTHFVFIPYPEDL